MTTSTSYQLTYITCRLISAIFSQKLMTQSDKSITSRSTVTSSHWLWKSRLRNVVALVPTRKRKTEASCGLTHSFLGHVTVNGSDSKRSAECNIVDRVLFLLCHALLYNRFLDSHTYGELSESVFLLNWRRFKYGYSSAHRLKVRRKYFDSKPEDNRWSQLTPYEPQRFVNFLYSPSKKKISYIESWYWLYESFGLPLQHTADLCSWGQWVLRKFSVVTH